MINPAYAIMLCASLMMASGVRADSDKYDPDLDNPASTAPGYETLNKAKDKLDSIGESLGNAKKRFDQAIGIGPQEPKYDEDGWTIKEDPPGNTPPPSGAKMPAPKAPTPRQLSEEETLAARKKALDIMTSQAQKNEADYAALQAQCGNGPETREECLKRLERYYWLPPGKKRLRELEGLQNSDFMQKQPDQTSRGVSLDNLMAGQKQIEAREEARQAEIAARQRNMAEQERQRQLAIQREEQARQAQEAQRIQAQRDAGNAAALQNVMGAFMGAAAAFSGNRAAPVNTFIPSPAMNAPSYNNTYTAPRPAQTNSRPATSYNCPPRPATCGIRD